MMRYLHPALKRIFFPLQRLMETGGSKINLESPKSASEPEINDATQLFLSYNQHARNQGFDRLYFSISFDCDTPEDIPAAEKLNQWMLAHNIPATYAVPGAMLLKGRDVYHRIANSGATFINHGASSHTEWRDGRYWSTTFYHEMTPEMVVADIRRGHQIVEQVIGQTPNGFRAPHFGNFQKPEQRKILYDELKILGYLYSSSTLPGFGFEHGPVVNVDGLWEIPLSGSFISPYSIFDSWSYIVSPYQPQIKDEYRDLIIHTLTQLQEMGVCGLLNYYVDPAHVVNTHAFYQSLEFICSSGIPVIRFYQAIDLIKRYKTSV